MRRFIAVLMLGLLCASPAHSQEPCSLSVHIPVNLHVGPPVCPGQPLDLVAEACGPCVDLLGWTWNPGEPIRIRAILRPGNCIITLCQPDSLRIPIGTFAAGHYQMAVEVLGTVELPDSTSCTVVQHQEVFFDVPLSCVSPPGSLPYTSVILIGPPPPCATCPPPPICPQREIPFFVAGQFPDNCYNFRRLELLPSPIASPLPQPPIARITVGYNDCMGIPCLATPVPWQAGALMPGLPPGNYGMIVQMQEVSWCDSNRVIHQYSTIVPFTVAADCSIPAPSCFLYGWRPNPADPYCDTRVGPGTPGQLFLDISGAGLAGLQGRLAMMPPALRVSDLHLVGPGSIGMQFVWHELPDGANFVAYSNGGGLLTCSSAPCPWGIEVTVSPRPGMPIPDHSELSAVDLLATDALGHAVPLCPTLVPIRPARICAGSSCDFNRDGQVDVRDLVGMVRCIRDSTTCPDSTSGTFDCNGDGRFNLDDVLCCARVILHGRMPDSVATRPAPELRLAVGAATVTATGVDLPIRIMRADLVGAARLAFSYPAATFGGAEVELLGDASQWIDIGEATQGELVVGLIATTPDGQLPADLSLVLHFGLASGQQASSAIDLVASEFAGRDGMPLTPGLPTSSVPPAAIDLALSQAQPNPFGTETRFVLSVARDTDADLAVFDLTGRRMTTLHRGPIAAGEHTFRWNGTTLGGTRVHDGVYFYRAVASGVSVTRKLVLLRGK